MLVLARSIKGAAFWYNAASAHEVPKRSAGKIRDILNRNNYQLKEGEEWYLHDVGYYDNGYYYAKSQRFTIYKGSVIDHR